MLFAISPAFGVTKPPPDLSGSWRLNRERSTGPWVPKAATALEITQRGDEIKFVYFSAETRTGSEAFLADGLERDRYSTRIERAFAKAQWHGDELVIITRHTLDQFGYQTYSETDTWTLSTDRKTLTNKLSDGSVLVYEKQASPDLDPIFPADPLRSIVPFRMVGLITGTGPCHGTSFEGAVKSEPLGSGTVNFCGPPPQNWGGKVGSCGVHSGILSFNKDGGGTGFKMTVIGQFCITDAGGTFRGTYEVERISVTGAFAGQIKGGSGEVEFSNASNTIYVHGVLLKEPQATAAGSR
jgi:hypothetical protein